LTDNLNSEVVTDAGEAAALVEGAAALLVKTQDVQRQLLDPPPPDIWSFDGHRRLLPAIMSPVAPWLTLRTPELEGPGMITDEEKLYYAHIGNFYRGIGQAVELGPWLGASTRYIIAGLDPNPRFSGHRLFRV